MLRNRLELVLLAATLALGCSVVSRLTPTPQPTAPPSPTAAATTPVPVTATRPRPSATPQPSASATRRAPAGTATRAATRTPRPPTATRARGVLFADDFSDPDFGNWDLRSSGDYVIEIAGGVLLMEMERPEWSAWTTTGETAGDFVVEVDATWRGGPEENEFGLILRLDSGRSGDAFYTFGVSSTGEYSVWLFANDAWSALIDWRASAAIRTERGELNHLLVVADGPLLRFYINDQPVDELDEGTLSEGQYGLYLATTDEAGVRVTFDNFVVSALEVAPPRGPAPTPRAPTPTLAPGVLFADDFSDAEAAGWSLRRTTDYRIEILDGQMIMAMNQPEWSAWTTTGATAGDAVIEVDATWLEGPEENEFGIIFRLAPTEDDEDFYTFGISMTGEYSLWLRSAGDWETLADWRRSGAIRTGVGEINRLRVEAVGAEILLSINGVEVERLTDTTLAEGEFGLYLATTEEPGLVVAFDNFVVAEPGR
jgi:hypothetical protein